MKHKSVLIVTLLLLLSLVLGACQPVQAPAGDERGGRAGQADSRHDDQHAGLRPARRDPA